MKNSFAYNPSSEEVEKAVGKDGGKEVAGFFVEQGKEYAEEGEG